MEFAVGQTFSSSSEAGIWRSRPSNAWSAEYPWTFNERRLGRSTFRHALFPCLTILWLHRGEDLLEPLCKEFAMTLRQSLLPLALRSHDREGRAIISHLLP